MIRDSDGVAGECMECQAEGRLKHFAKIEAGIVVIMSMLAALRNISTPANQWSVIP